MKFKLNALNLFGIICEIVHYLSCRTLYLQAMQGWGKVLRTWYGKDPDVRYEDPTVKYLGYWTDNGK